jgi:DNA-binding response OmpR family regulator
MEVESWKEPLLKLPLSELKKVQAFISELIQTEELVQESKEEAIVIFPKFNVGEQRKDQRISLSIEGTCSIVTGNETEGGGDEIPIQIMDISKHGLRFLTNKHIPPSSVLLVKFHLASTKQTDDQFYKNPYKKIYSEVRRVIEIKTPKGVKYDIGALSIDNEKVIAYQENQKGYNILNKQALIKGDIRILLLHVKESRSQQLEESLLKENYIVIKAHQKQQAIASLRKSRCNVVVSDFQTATINDAELIKDIKEEFPDIGLMVEVDTIDDWKKIIPLGVDEYLTKDFTIGEFNIILQYLYKKLLSKSIFGNYFRKKALKYQSVLAISKNEELRKFLCNISSQSKIKMYFVSYIEHAHTVLNTYKVDLIVVDSETTHLDGCKFIVSARNGFPGIVTVVKSNNPGERTDFIGNGADYFTTDATNIRQILTQ